MSILARSIAPALAVVIALQAHAQGKYGATREDSIRCVQNLSLYQEFFSQKNYDDALDPWRQAMAICPASSKKMYVDGVAMRRHFALKAGDPKQKAALLDSMYQVYDQRIKHFGERAFVLGRKGADMMQYSPERCADAHAVLKESVASAGAKSEDVALSAYYQSLHCLYSNGQVTKDQMVAEYVTVMGYVEANLARDLKDDQRTYWNQARDNINAIFFKVAECEDIGRIAAKAVQESPDDPGLKARMLRVLNTKECTDEAIYRTLAEDVHRANPSSESAYGLGIFLARRNDLAGAGRYFKEAVDLCGGCSDKVKYLLKAGQVASANGSHALARSYANQVLQLEPKNGEALMLIGNAVAAMASGCEAPDNWGVYWLAYDYYQKARTLDPSVSDKASDRMSASAARFPTQSEAFFHQLKEGGSFQVTCGGLGETTTVRIRK